MRKVLLFLLLALPVFAQNSRYDSVALGPRGPIPNATVAVCTQPANTTTTPCSPLANLCSSLTDAVCTNPNPVTADSLGNYHYYVKTSQGPVTVQIYGPQVAASVVLPDQSIPVTATGFVKSLNNIQFADQFAGADACAKISSALAALPANGGVVDARGFTGTQVCASDPFAAYSGAGTLMLGNSVIGIQACWNVPTEFSIIGSGRGDNSSKGTYIHAIGGFSGCGGQGMMIRLGKGTSTFGNRIENLTLDCDGQAPCGGVYSTDINEQSGVFRVNISNFTTYGIFVDETVSQNAQNWSASDVELFGHNNAATGIFVKGTPATFNTGPKLLERITVSGINGTTLANGIQLENIIDSVVIGVHGEGTSGATLALGDVTGPVLNITGIDINGGNTSSGPIVRLSNAGTTSIRLFGVHGVSPATLNIDNTINGTTEPLGHLSEYKLGINKILGSTNFLETTAPSGVANQDSCYGDSTAHALKCSYNNGTFLQVPQVIGSGTATMTTAAITAGNCGTTVTVAAIGVLTSDAIIWSFNAAPAGSNAGLVSWPTTNNVNFAYCPNTAETPAAATINWRVIH